jgi:hypothetical protein
MPPRKIIAKDGIYFPMDGPWQSDEDNEAFAEAEKIFDAWKEDKPYVALIQSHHPYSHGYWIETVKKEIKYPDLILKEHKVIV